MGFDLRIPRGQSLLVTVFGLGLLGFACGQTASTGAVMGVTLDPVWRDRQGAVVHLTKTDGPEGQSAMTDESGWFQFPLLSPGIYVVELNATSFQTVSLPHIPIQVTEALRLELHLDLAIQLRDVPSLG